MSRKISRRSVSDTTYSGSRSGSILRSHTDFGDSRGSFYNPVESESRPKLNHRVSGASERSRVSFSLSQHLDKGLDEPGSDSDSEGAQDEDIVTDFVPFISRSSSAASSGSGLKLSRRRKDLETKLNSINHSATSASKIQPTAADGGVVLYDIVASKYGVEAGKTDEITASLDYITPTSTSATHPDSLFRWIHISDATTDFDKFSKCARENATSLGYEDNHGLDNFLVSIRKKLEKSFRVHGETIGKYMKTGCIASTAPTSGEHDTHEKSYLFLSLNFHQLAKYSPRPSGLSQKTHFARTLLQNKYPHSSKQRDLKQAVCSLDSTLDGQCFYTPTLWCLMIDNGFMLSWASGNSIQRMCQDTVKLQRHTSPTPPTPLTARKTIHLRYDGRLYILPISQCRTWFALMQTLSSITLCLEDQFYLKWNEIRILPELWTVLLAESKDNNVAVHLIRRRERIQHFLRTQSMNLHLVKTTSQMDASGESLLSPVAETTPRDSFTLDGSPGRVRSNSFSSRRPERTSQVSAAHTLEDTEPDDKETAVHIVNKSSRPDEKASRNFHMLIWLAMSEEKSGSNSAAAADDTPTKIGQQKGPNQQVVHSYLDSLHAWLEDQSDPDFKQLYRKTDSKTLMDIERVMSGMKKARLDSGDTHDLKTQFVDAVKTTFALFLPLNQRCQIASKVWGAVMTFATGKVEEDDIPEVDTAVTKLVELAVLAKTISAQLSNGKAPAPGALSIPPAALRVLYSFLYSVLLWPYPRGLTEAQRYTTKAFTLLTRTHRQLLRDMDATKLSDLESVRPKDLISIISNIVLADITGTQPDIVTSYWQSLNSMFVPIQSEPLNRQNQQKLVAFIDEGGIVSESLDDQKDAIKELQTNLKARAGSNRSFPLLQEALNALDANRASIDELVNKAGEFLNQSDDMRRENKDKQEAAIYVFTIITIIFLPISTVASIFGMNTQDIRNLESSQWLFWAVAMPLTFVVIIISLFFGGILHSPMQWMKQKTVYDEVNSNEPVKQGSASVESKNARSKKKGKWSNESNDSDFDG